MARLVVLSLATLLLVAFPAAAQSPYYFLPPTAATGDATAVTDTTATLNGRVDPHGSAAFYAFEFGSGEALGRSTPPAAAGADRAVSSVATTVTGLTPATTYRFRITAAGAGGTVFGEIARFTTLAEGGVVRPRPGLTLRVRPKRDATRPYTFRATGRLRRSSGVARAAGCRGRVRVTVTRGGRPVLRRTTTVTAACRYAAPLRVRRSGRGTLRLRARFGGNAALRPVSSRAVRVRYGPPRDR